MYLWEGDEESAAAFLSAGETQITIRGVESPGCVAAGVRRPHGARGQLVELLCTRKPKQSQDVLPQSLLLQDPGEEQSRFQHL